MPGGLARTLASPSCAPTEIQRRLASPRMMDTSFERVFVMARKRREVTPEYKNEAVELVVNTGRAGATVARELGINEASLGRRVSVFKARQDPGETTVTESEWAELQRLRKENGDLKLDRALLKKELIFFT